MAGSSAADKQATPAWRRVSVPWFILGFLALVVANSFVTLPTQVASRGLELSKFLLLLAVTATAMRSQLGLVIGAGWRPLVPVLAATLGSFAAALAITMMVIE